MFQSIRLFLITSGLFLLIAGCSHYTLQGTVNKKNKQYTLPFFTEIGQEQLFRITIDAFKNEMSGICVIKTLGRNHHRVAVLSDFGNTLLDFEVKEETVTVHYVMDDLNKKVIVNQLKKYFQLLLNTEYDVTKSAEQVEGLTYQSKLQGKRIFIDLTNDLALESIRQASLFKTKTQINYFQTADVLDSIQLKSYGLPIKMKFVRMQ